MPYLLAIGLIIWGIKTLYDNIWNVALVLFFLLVGFIAVTLLVCLPGSSPKRNKAVDDFVEGAVKRHKKTLMFSKSAGIKRDKYGIEDKSGWHAEREYFIKNVLAREASPIVKRLIADGKFNYSIHETIEKSIANADFEIATLPPDITPERFEVLCMEVFRASGWNATTTKASGDQGADVIAERDSLIVVVQCKLYGTPVGNKAVQEVIAARGFYNADIALVVANSSFTRSALQLAQVSDVKTFNYLEFVDYVQSLSAPVGLAAKHG